MKVNNHNNKKLQNFQKFIKLMANGNLNENQKYIQNISKIAIKTKN